MSILDHDFSQADPANLETVVQEFRSDSRWTALIEVVDARFEGRTGYSPTANSLGPELLVEWINELRSVVDEAKRYIDDAADKAEREHESLHYAWEDYGREFDGDLVAWISEKLGGAEDLTAGEFGVTDAWLRSVRSALSNDDIATAASSMQEAGERIAETHRKWSQFLEDGQAGAGRAITTLEITRDQSFNVVVGLATSGATSWLGVTSTLGQAAVGGVVAAGARGVQGGATYVGHVLAGTTQDFDVTDELVEVLKAGAGQFVDGAVAGWLEGYTEELAGPLAERLAPYLGEHASAWATYAVQKAAEQGAGSFAQVVASTTIDVAEGYRFNSTEHLLSYLGHQFLTTWRDNLIQDIVEDSARGNTIDTDILVKKVYMVFNR